MRLTKLLKTVLESVIQNQFLSWDYIIGTDHVKNNNNTNIHLEFIELDKIIYHL